MTKSAEIKKLEDLIRDIRFAMMTTVENDGSLRSRPMATELKDFDGCLWFFTKDDSPKSIELQEDPRVNVSFSDPERGHYASVSGEGELVHDRAKLNDFWSPAYLAWFPKGLEDPAIALIRVRVRKAEYWDASSGRMVTLSTDKAKEPGGDRKLDLAG